ncbi:hypothetical protein GUJ93_ZPchr0006g42216 [Zizania palustris]|uniref:Uncharacterized protein n=1 Tax=Zizania palustris TaxID=103762 RepID=A0A8J5SI38_ZIZPA|nr:hypothetical protein GUJ93_ZPchr0006g42216 [Zizania palustris]
MHTVVVRKNHVGVAVRRNHIAVAIGRNYIAVAIKRNHAVAREAKPAEASVLLRLIPAKLAIDARPSRLRRSSATRAAKMEYDYRGRQGSGSYVGGGSSLYPRVGQPSHGIASVAPPPPSRAAPYHHHGPPSGSPAPAAPHPVPSSSTSSKFLLPALSALVGCLVPSCTVDSSIAGELHALCMLVRIWHNNK